MSDLATPAGDGWEELPAATPGAPKLASPSGDGWEELPASRPTSAASDGVLTNTGDESMASSAAKNTATGVLKGVSHIPGAYGDIRDFGRYVADRAISGLTGASMEDIEKKRIKGLDEDLADTIGEKTGYRPHLPSGAEIHEKVIAPHTGEYVPDTEAGKLVQAGIEAGVGGIGSGGGALKSGSKIGSALKSTITPKVGSINAASGAVGEGVTEVTGDPLYGMGAGMLTGSAGEHVGAPFAKKIGQPLSAIVSDTAKHKAAAERFFGLAEDPEALQESLRHPQRDQMVEGAPLTTGQAHGDAKILQEERRLLSKDEDFRVKHRDLEQQQNEAHLNALKNASTTDASAKDLVTDIENRHNEITKRYDEQERILTQKAQEAAARLGDKADPAEIGQNLRNAIQEVRAAEQKEINALYNKVDPNKDMRIVATPIREQMSKIRAGENDYTEYSPHASILNKLDDLPEIMSFDDVRGLDRALSERMSAERRSSGETESWRALKDLKGAVKDSINNAIAHQIEWERAAGVSPEHSLEGRYGSLDAGAPVSGEPATGVDQRLKATGTDGGGDSLFPPEGGAARPADGGSPNVDRGAGLPASASPTGTNTLRYPGGKLDVRYKVVDLDSLKTSHDLNGNVNPDYPEEMQPRDRSTKASQDQVLHYGNNLDPELLGHSKVTSHGAPIVGPDGVVESGNGRTMSIGHNYAKGDPAGYRKWVESQGYDTTGMKHPVLVAERTTELSPQQRVFMAEQSNGPSGLRMNATEQAGVDAKYLTPDVLDRLQSGALKGEANKDFVAAVMRKMSANDRGGMFDEKNGRLTPDGERRLQAALLQAAFSDVDLVQRGFTSSDNNIKNITGAMADASGAWSKMRAAAKEGAISADHDVTSELTDLVKDVMKARDEGRPVMEIINQADMLRGDVGNNVRALLMNGDKVASRQQITARLNKYAEEAIKNTGGGFLDDKVTPAKILETATGAKFEEAPPAPEAPKVESPYNEGAKEPPPPDAPNITPGTASDLAKANKKYGDYAQTYKKGDVGSVLKTDGFAGQYKVMDSAIAKRAIKAGDVGYETAQKFLKAAKNGKEAVSAMKEAMLNHVRAAMGPDGTINPKKLETTLGKFSGAIRALEEASPGFAKSLENPKKASEALISFAAEKKEAINTLNKSAAAKFMGLRNPSDIEREVGRLLTGKNVARVQEVLNGMSPEALDGFRRAALDWVLKNKTNTARVGTSESPRLSFAGIDKLLKLDRGVLNTVFTKEQVSSLRAIKASLERIDRTVTATGVKGSPGTEIGFKEHLRSAIGKGNEALNSALLPIGTGLGAGSIFGILAGIPVAFGTAAGVHFLGAGERAIENLVKEAVLKPEVARRLSKLAPPRDTRTWGQWVAGALTESLTTDALAGSRPILDEEGVRRARASGGRLGRQALTAQQLISGLENMRKTQQKGTEGILNKPDETVVRALHQANNQL